MKLWKARLGMLYRCVGVLWLSLLNRSAVAWGQDAETFAFYPWRGGTIYKALCNIFCKISIWGCFIRVLLTVSHDEDTWIFLESWRTCFTHTVPSKRNKKLKPYNLVCCERCSRPPWPGSIFSSSMHTACICFPNLCKDLLHDSFWPALLWYSFQKISTWVYIFLHKQNKQDF